jgi:hypothetical protein
MPTSPDLAKVAYVTEGKWTWTILVDWATDEIVLWNEWDNDSNTRCEYRLGTTNAFQLGRLIQGSVAMIDIANDQSLR